MDVNGGGGYTSSSSCITNTNSASTQSDDQEEMMMMMMQEDLRRGPWTVEEDLALINYIANHGEGRWNSLARCAGLKRTGKSCRLRWLNYLRPDVRRGNITLEEQLIILELHSRWGNRWSKIAQHLPGRTDNEIKNYWRTRVQKQAKQLQCDVNSKQFKDAMRYLWMPRLVERIKASTTSSSTSTTSTTDHHYNNHHHHHHHNNRDMNQLVLPTGISNDFNGAQIINPSFTPENSSTAASSPVNNTHYYPINGNFPSTQNAHATYPECQTFSSGYYDHQGLGFHQGGFDQQNMWLGGEDVLENSWNVEDLWFLQQQFNNNGI